jgi:hypothetical protein
MRAVCLICLMTFLVVYSMHLVRAGRVHERDGDYLAPPNSVYGRYIDHESDIELDRAKIPPHHSIANLERENFTPPTSETPWTEPYPTTELDARVDTADIP